MTTEQLKQRRANLMNSLEQVSGYINKTSAELNEARQVQTKLVGALELVDGLLSEEEGEAEVADKKASPELDTDQVSDEEE